MEPEVVKAQGVGGGEPGAGSVEYQASREIKRFRRQFQAVFDLGEKLEELVLLDQAIAERKRLLGSHKAEQESILGKILDEIHSAEKSLYDLKTSAVAEHEGKVEAMKAQQEGLRAELEAEIETLRAERDALLESNRNAEEQLMKRSDELYTVETRLRQIRERFGEKTSGGGKQ